MNSKTPTREEAFTLLKKYNQSESLIKHALAVESVMRYFARKRGEDEDKWGIIGLVHDLDYEKFPRGTLPEKPGNSGIRELARGIYQGRGQPRMGDLL